LLMQLGRIFATWFNLWLRSAYTIYQEEDEVSLRSSKDNKVVVGAVQKAGARVSLSIINILVGTLCRTLIRNTFLLRDLLSIWPFIYLQST
jgi:hypothetical protein